MWCDLIHIIFNESSADIIQHISVFLELFGLSLAVMEYKYPQVAHKLENWVDKFSEKSNRYSIKLVNSKNFSSIVTITCFFIFFITIPWIFGFYNAVFKDHLINTVFDAGFYVSIIMFTTLLAYLTVPLLGDFIERLNKFSDGHAVGSFGILVAIIGLFGNIYQEIVTLIY